MTDKLPDGFCILPWINQHIAVSGAISPCCEFGDEIANLDDTTLADAWNSPKLASIRSAFLDGKPLKACSKCYDRERNESSSMRLESNALFARWLEPVLSATNGHGKLPDYPVAFDLRFTNLCNFKCRSCWHGSSSKWFSDAKAMGVAVGDRAEINSFGSAESFMEQVGPGLEHLEHIYFAGGEPLMMAEHYVLLEKLVALGRTDVVLAYNTNMSVLSFRDWSVVKLWKEFENVQVSASIDATGELGAMMRNGFDWQTFVSNVKSVRRHCPLVQIEFGVTVSALNILHLPELLNALRNACDATPGSIHLHSLQEPVYYRTQILPRRLKRRASAQLMDYLDRFQAEYSKDTDGRFNHRQLVEGVVDYMNAADLPKQRIRMDKMMRRLDALRGEDSERLMPELAPYLSRSRQPVHRVLLRLQSLLHNSE